MQFKATELFTNINIVSNLGGIVADCPEGGSGWCTAGSGCQGTNCTGTSFEPGACDGGGSGGCDPDSGSLLKSPITVALGVDPAEFELLAPLASAFQPAGFSADRAALAYRCRHRQPVTRPGARILLVLLHQ